MSLREEQLEKTEYKGEVTRQRLLAEAIELFAKHGFAETSFQMIADRCGLSQSAVLYHFRSKRVLIEEVIGAVTAHNHHYVDRHMQPTDTGVQRLNKFALYNVAWGADHRSHIQVLLLLYYYAYIDEHFETLHFKFLDIAKNRILGHVLAAQREGDIRKDLDAKRITDILFDIKLAVLTEAIEAHDRKSAVREYSKKWHTLLGQFLTSADIIKTLKIDDK